MSTDAQLTSEALSILSEEVRRTKIKQEQEELTLDDLRKIDVAVKIMKNIQSAIPDAPEPEDFMTEEELIEAAGSFRAKKWEESSGDTTPNDTEG